MRTLFESLAWQALGLPPEITPLPNRGNITHGAADGFDILSSASDRSWHELNSNPQAPLPEWPADGHQLKATTEPSPQEKIPPALPSGPPEPKTEKEEATNASQDTVGTDAKQNTSAAPDSHINLQENTAQAPENFPQYAANLIAAARSPADLPPGTVKSHGTQLPRTDSHDVIELSGSFYAGGADETRHAIKPAISDTPASHGWPFAASGEAAFQSPAQHLVKAQPVLPVEPALQSSQVFQSYFGESGSLDSLVPLLPPSPITYSDIDAHSTPASPCANAASENNAAHTPAPRVLDEPPVRAAAECPAANPFAHHLLSEADASFAIAPQSSHDAAVSSPNASISHDSPATEQQMEDPSTVSAPQSPSATHVFEYGTLSKHAHHAESGQPFFNSVPQHFTTTPEVAAPFIAPPISVSSGHRVDQQGISHPASEESSTAGARVTPNPVERVVTLTLHDEKNDSLTAAEDAAGLSSAAGISPVQQVSTPPCAAPSFAIEAGTEATSLISIRTAASHAVPIAAATILSQQHLRLSTAGSEPETLPTAENCTRHIAAPTSLEASASCSPAAQPRDSFSQPVSPFLGNAPDAASHAPTPQQTQPLIEKSSSRIPAITSDRDAGYMRSGGFMLKEASAIPASESLLCRSNFSAALGSLEDSREPSRACDAKPSSADLPQVSQPDDTSLAVAPRADSIPALVGSHETRHHQPSGDSDLIPETRRQPASSPPAAHLPAPAVANVPSARAIPEMNHPAAGITTIASADIPAPRSASPQPIVRIPSLPEGLFTGPTHANHRSTPGTAPAASTAAPHLFRSKSDIAESEMPDSAANQTDSSPTSRGNRSTKSGDLADAGANQHHPDISDSTLSPTNTRFTGPTQEQVILSHTNHPHAAVAPAVHFSIAPAHPASPAHTPIAHAEHTLLEIPPTDSPHTVTSHAISASADDEPAYLAPSVERIEQTSSRSSATLHPQRGAADPGYQPHASSTELSSMASEAGELTKHRAISGAEEDWLNGAEPSSSITRTHRASPVHRPPALDPAAMASRVHSAEFLKTVGIASEPSIFGGTQNITQHAAAIESANNNAALQRFALPHSSEPAAHSLPQPALRSTGAVSPQAGASPVLRTGDVSMSPPETYSRRANPISNEGEQASITVSRPSLNLQQQPAIPASGASPVQFRTAPLSPSQAASALESPRVISRKVETSPEPAPVRIDIGRVEVERADTAGTQSITQHAAAIESANNNATLQRSALAYSSVPAARSLPQQAPQSAAAVFPQPGASPVLRTGHASMSPPEAYSKRANPISNDGEKASATIASRPSQNPQQQPALPISDASPVQSRTAPLPLQVVNSLYSPRVISRRMETSPEPAPVRIDIGRMEVERADTEASSSARARRTRPIARFTLDQYLKQRSRSR